MAEYTLVVSGRTDDTVVLNERDPLHPDGEAFVGAKFNGRGQLVPVAVGMTAAVVRLLHDKQLVEVDESGDPVDDESQWTPEEFLPVTLGSGERPVGESDEQRHMRLSAAAAFSGAPMQMQVQASPEMAAAVGLDEEGLKARANAIKAQEETLAKRAEELGAREAALAEREKSPPPAATTTPTTPEQPPKK